MLLIIQLFINGIERARITENGWFFQILSSGAGFQNLNLRWKNTFSYSNWPGTLDQGLFTQLKLQKKQNGSPYYSAKHDCKINCSFFVSADKSDVNFRLQQKIFASLKPWARAVYPLGKIRCSHWKFYIIRQDSATERFLSMLSQSHSMWPLTCVIVPCFMA